MTRRIAVIAALALAIVSTPALARHQNQKTSTVTEFCGARYGKCYDGTENVSTKKQLTQTHRAQSSDATIIGGRPEGCPYRYCGCGLRKYLGIADVRLNLAWNWAKLFPREKAPRPGLAAVRRGHVMYIEAEAGDGRWLIRDYNSGDRLSRLHVRDVRGFVFVNPHTRIAQQ